MVVDVTETSLSPFGIGTKEDVWKKHIRNPYDFRQVAAKHDRDLFKRGVSSLETAILWHPEDAQLLRRLFYHKSRPGDTIMDVARAVGISVYGAKRLAWSLKLDVMEPFILFVQGVMAQHVRRLSGNKRVEAPEIHEVCPRPKNPFVPGPWVDVVDPVEPPPLQPNNPWAQFAASENILARGYTRRFRWRGGRRNKFSF